MVKNTVLVWDRTKYNYGSHYNTSNGKFSVPVTGLYLVNIQIVGATHNADYCLNVHNGNTQRSITRSSHINYGDNDGIVTGTTSVVLELNQGNQLYIIVPTFTGSDAIYGNHGDHDMMNSYFSATLLSTIT